MDLTDCVEDVRQMFQSGNMPSIDSVNLAVYKAACEIRDTRPGDFIHITEVPPKDGTYRFTTAFLDEKFFRSVTILAYSILGVGGCKLGRLTVIHL